VVEKKIIDFRLKAPIEQRKCANNITGRSSQNGGGTSPLSREDEIEPLIEDF
jgi:hypothetical protein